MYFLAKFGTEKKPWQPETWQDSTLFSPPENRAAFSTFCVATISLQGGPGTEPEPETGTVATVFPGTERGTGTAGTVFQEPKPEPKPSFPVKLYWNTESLFLQRNRRNRKPEPLEPFHPQTVTEPNRTGATLSLLNCTENLEKMAQKSTGENSPQKKDQCPEIADCCALSWSNVSWKWIPLGIPRCNYNPKVFHRNFYNFEEFIRLGIKKCNCNCNVQNYPMAGNQYINNSPDMFLLYSRGCEYLRDMYSHWNEFSQEFGWYA